MRLTSRGASTESSWPFADEGLLQARLPESIPDARQTAGGSHAQAMSPKGSNGRPAQMQAEGLVAVFFDDREGITYTVRMPLFKDDNWNLGGYFTIASGKRVPIEGWSPQAAQGRGRELIRALLVAGRIDPSLISARRTHERCLGGDGGQHWLPLARQSFRDGQAAYWAYEAARIPTGSAPKGGSPEFERGWREARTVRSVAAGVAVVSNMLAVAGPVATSFRMPQG